MGPRKLLPNGDVPYTVVTPRKRRQPDKNTEEYFKKRERNNIAVKKSRDKARMKQKETSQLVHKLRQENADLDKKVQILSKELEVLRSLFLSHAASVKAEPIDDKFEQSEFNSEEEKSEPKLTKIALIDHEYCS